MKNFQKIKKAEIFNSLIILELKNRHHFPFNRRGTKSDHYFDTIILILDNQQVMKVG